MSYETSSAAPLPLPVPHPPLLPPPSPSSSPSPPTTPQLLPKRYRHWPTGTSQMTHFTQREVFVETRFFTVDGLHVCSTCAPKTKLLDFTVEFEYVFEHLAVCHKVRFEKNVFEIFNSFIRTFFSVT